MFLCIKSIVRTDGWTMYKNKHLNGVRITRVHTCFGLISCVVHLMFFIFLSCCCSDRHFIRWKLKPVYMLRFIRCSCIGWQDKTKGVWTVHRLPFHHSSRFWLPFTYTYILCVQVQNKGFLFSKWFHWPSVSYTIFLHSSENLNGSYFCGFVILVGLINVFSLKIAGNISMALYFWWIDMIETKHFHGKRNWSISLVRLFNKTMNSIHHLFNIHRHTNTYNTQTNEHWTLNTHSHIHAYFMPKVSDVSHRPCHHTSKG